MNASLGGAEVCLWESAIPGELIEEATAQAAPELL